MADAAQSGATDLVKWSVGGNLHAADGDNHRERSREEPPSSPQMGRDHDRKAARHYAEGRRR